MRTLTPSHANDQHGFQQAASQVKVLMNEMAVMIPPRSALNGSGNTPRPLTAQQACLCMRLSLRLSPSEN